MEYERADAVRKWYCAWQTGIGHGGVALSRAGLDRLTVSGAGWCEFGQGSVWNVQTGELSVIGGVSGRSLKTAGSPQRRRLGARLGRIYRAPGSLLPSSPAGIPNRVRPRG